MSAIGPQFYEYMKKLDENGGKLPASITSRPFLPEFEFNNSTCNLCNGYYGPSFGEPVCVTCHEFLYPDIPHHLPNSYIFSEKTEDGDSGNDEPSVGELMYNDRRLTRALQQQGIPNWAFRFQNSLDSEASPEDPVDPYNGPSHSRHNPGGPNAGGPSNPNRSGASRDAPDDDDSDRDSPNDDDHNIGPIGNPNRRPNGGDHNRGPDFGNLDRDDPNYDDLDREGAYFGPGNPNIADPNMVDLDYGDLIRGPNYGAGRGDDRDRGNDPDEGNDPDGGDDLAIGDDMAIGDDPERDGANFGQPGPLIDGLNGDERNYGEVRVRPNYGGPDDPDRDSPDEDEPRGNRGPNGGDPYRIGPYGDPYRAGPYGDPYRAGPYGDPYRGGPYNGYPYYGGPNYGGPNYGFYGPIDDGLGPAVPDDGYPRPLPSSLARSLAALSTPRPPDNLAPGLVEQLPSEVLLCMFSYLDDLSLCACALVCTRWLRLVRARVAQPRWAGYASRRWPLFRPMVNIHDWHKKYQALVESCFCRNCVVQMCMQSQPPFEENAWRRNRLRNEIKMLRNTPPEGCAATPLDPKCCHWQAMVTGPVGSPYEGGVYYLYIQVPYSYPMSPPVVRFLTRILHPNVSRHGDVGIDSVHHNWSLALTISKLLISIQSLLTDPYTAVCMEPEVGEMYVNDRVRFERIARRWTWRYAMHDMYSIY